MQLELPCVLGANDLPDPAAVDWQQQQRITLRTDEGLDDLLGLIRQEQDFEACRLHFIREGFPYWCVVKDLGWLQDGDWLCIEDTTTESDWTLYQLLTYPLPQSQCDLHLASSTSTNQSAIYRVPRIVKKWKTYQNRPLIDHVLEHQAAADNRNQLRGARCPPEVNLASRANSESAVQSDLWAYGVRLLSDAAPHPRPHWELHHPAELFKLLLSFTPELQGEGVQQPLQPQQQQAQHSQQPPQQQPPQHLQQPPQQQPPQHSQQPPQQQQQQQQDSSHVMPDILLLKQCPNTSNTIAAMVIEMKKPGILMNADGTMRDLRAGFKNRDRVLTSVLAQKYSYMLAGNGMCLGMISCYFGSCMLYCPPDARDTLFVSDWIRSTDRYTQASRAMTTRGAIHWMQGQALAQQSQHLPIPEGLQSLTEYLNTPSEDPMYQSPEDAGALHFSSDVTCEPSGSATEDTDSSCDAGSSRQHQHGSYKAATGSMQPNQWKLQLDSVLSVGRWSVVVRGKANGQAVAIKFFGPDAQGLAAWTNEMRVYDALKGVQGSVIPKLVAAGKVTAWPGIMFLATSLVEGMPLSSLPVVSSEVAAAATAALKEICKQQPGFLHEDLRLANLLCRPGAQDDAKPSVVVIDFEVSRLDGSTAECTAQFKHLRKRLGA